MPEIRTEETIAAPPELVWQILTDVAAYPDWNPFILEGEGNFRAGEKMKLRMRPPGGREMTFRPTVLVAEPGRELRWRGRLLIPGLFDGEHWFLLQPDGNGTWLEQGERFSGVLPRFMSGMLAATKQGFTELNAALKERAEARTESGPGPQ